MIEHIPDIAKAGIYSLKIEGRMKTPFYVGTVVKAYRQAIDDYFADPKDVYKRQVYRKFVYENYTAVDEKLLPLLNRIFKEGETENDGIYSVVSHIREVLKAQASYTESVSIPHNEEDPIRYFLCLLYTSTRRKAR